MAFSDLLVNRLYTYRRPASSFDRFGQAVEADPTGSAHEVYACRYSRSRGGKQNSERVEEQFEQLYDIYVEAGADIRTDDLLVVKDLSGNTIFTVSRVQQRSDVYGAGNTVHHVELTAWVQSGPDNGPGVS